MRWGVLIFIGFTFFSSQAQVTESSFVGKTNPFVLDSFKTIVGITGDVQFGSNAIDNIFANKMAFGGHIKRDRIEDIYAGINKKGRANVDAQTGIYYFQDANKRKWNLMAGVSIRWTGQSNFDKDVFGFLFRGNKPYAGTTMDIKNSNATLLHYNKYTVGAHTRVIKEGVMSKMGASISYIQGLDYLRFESKNTKLFTAIDGEYIDMDLQYEVIRADRHRKFMETIGNGAAIDLFYSTTLKNGIYLEANANDIGFLSFKDLGKFSKDTMGVHFEGHRITEGGGSLSQVLDSLDDIVSAKEERTKKSIFLPAIFDFRIGKQFGEVLVADLLVRYTVTEESFPLFKLRALKKINKGYYGMSYTYGGQERSGRIGIFGNRLIANKLFAQATVEGIEAYLAPKTFQGMRAMVGFAYLLN